MGRGSAPAGWILSEQPLHCSLLLTAEGNPDLAASMSQEMTVTQCGMNHSWERFCYAQLVSACLVHRPPWEVKAQGCLCIRCIRYISVTGTKRHGQKQHREEHLFCLEGFRRGCNGQANMAAGSRSRMLRNVTSLAHRKQRRWTGWGEPFEVPDCDCFLWQGSTGSRTPANSAIL